MSKGLEYVKDFQSMTLLTELAQRKLKVIEKELEEKEKQDDYIKSLEDRIDNLETTYLRNRKALEIIKVLFQGRARLYERNDGIQQIIDKNGHYNKCGCVVYILDFHVGSVHYEFHLHKDEYDSLKEVFYELM